MNYIISICEPGALEILTGICRELNLKMTATMRGRGTAIRSMLDLLGIESTEKRVLLTVAGEEQTKRFIEMQKQKLFIGVPGHGIVVSIPIKSVGGGKTVAFLNNEQQSAKYAPEINYAYELIVAIANEGRTDLVMNAARSAGVTGGTVLHAKGTADEEKAKFFNVSIGREKEIILMVAKTEKKSEIMKTILQKAGPDSEAGTIVFSLPISEVAGFGIL